MGLVEYKESLKNSLRQATLCFLLKDDKILLAMKKRGFGKGRWNGYGGKLNEGESMLEAAIRETQEEIGVTPKNLKPVACINFYFPTVPEDKNQNQQVFVFMTDSWDGEPQESDEMRPEWFKVETIPYKKMWPDDIYWLPEVLKGKKILAAFLFAPGDIVEDFEILEVDSLEPS